MKQEIISIETAKKLAEAEKNEKIIKEAIELIEAVEYFEKETKGIMRFPTNKLLNILRGKNEK